MRDVVLSLKDLPIWPISFLKVRLTPPSVGSGQKINRESFPIMAATENSPCIPTRNQFLAHWSECNTHEGAGSSRRESIEPIIS